jgi:O-antigen ligase
MLMVIPLAAAGAWASASGERLASARDFVSWLSASPAAAQMLLFATAAAIMGVSILISNSRSGIAALGVETALFALMIVSRQGSRRARASTVAVFVTIAVAVIAWAGVDQFLNRAATLSHDLPTGGGRFAAWRDTVRIVQDFPVAGTGLNTFGTAMVMYQSSDRALSFQEAHNDYLQLAAEGGVVLSVAIIIAAWALVRGIRARFKEAPTEGTTYWIRVGAVIALVGIAIQSAVEFSLQMPGNAALFAVVAALALHRSPNLRARASKHVA